MKRRNGGDDDAPDRPGAPVVDVPPEEAGAPQDTPGAEAAAAEPTAAKIVATARRLIAPPAPATRTG